MESCILLFSLSIAWCPASRKSVKGNELGPHCLSIDFSHALIQPSLHYIYGGVPLFPNDFDSYSSIEMNVDVVGLHPPMLGEIPEVFRSLVLQNVSLKFWHSFCIDLEYNLMKA
jgi:hypothetical protein